MNPPAANGNGAIAHARPDGLTPEEVAAYIAAHPDFIADHGDLILRTALPLRRQDGVIDFQSALLQRLRGDVDGLKDQQRALIGATRANHNTQSRVHTAVLFLLDCESFEQLIQTVTTDLAVLLDLDVAALLIEATDQDLAAAQIAGVQLVDTGFVDRHLGDRDLILVGEISGDPTVFGEAATLVRSQALARLVIADNAPPCLLALGSRESDMFHAGMRTDLIAFLARVLERCIRSWLQGRR